MKCWTDIEREELLERVKWKKKEWETWSTSRAVLVDMVYKAVDSPERRDTAMLWSLRSR